jgi:hypothetical protein
MGWAKGESGNPRGRTRGSSTWQTKMRRQITDMVPDIIGALRVQAAAGDTTAARLLLERALPPLRAVDLPVTLPLGQDLAAAAEAVQGALGAGAITPDQGQALAGVLASLAKIKETHELTRRIEALETRPQQGTLDLPVPEPNP